MPAGLLKSTGCQSASMGMFGFLVALKASTNNCDPSGLRQAVAAHKPKATANRIALAGSPPPLFRSFHHSTVVPRVITPSQAKPIWTDEWALAQIAKSAGNSPTATHQAT